MRILAALAFALLAIPAPAQEAVRDADRHRHVDESRDNPRGGERHRHGERQHAHGKRPVRCAYGVAKPGTPPTCETRPGDPNPYATRAGDPNPFATRAGDPNPYATKAGTPKR